jgi:peptidoglycan hydrolase-like protein with peptidoglycan-binding domain
MKILPLLLCACLIPGGRAAYAQTAASPVQPSPSKSDKPSKDAREQVRTQTPPPAEPARTLPPAVKKQPTAREREMLLRVQIFLDGELFSPGKLDGLPGEFTDKAVSRFQKAHGLDETGTFHNLPISRSESPYAEYTIRPEDRKFVGSLPARPEEQAKTQYLPYNSYWEFLAERFHCAEALLQYLNPSVSLEKLKVGDTVKVPAVEPFEIETLKSLGSLPEHPEFQSRRIHINRKERMLELLDNEMLLASTPITPGSASLPTPAGKWRLLAVSTMPVFRWDEGVLNRGVRTSNFFLLPPGPNNPVGVAWCALNRPGIGIHGTNNPETIGRAHSHGCMRVANWDIARLVQRITPGITVLIE